MARSGQKARLDLHPKPGQRWRTVWLQRDLAEDVNSTESACPPNMQLGERLYDGGSNRKQPHVTRMPTTVRPRHLSMLERFPKVRRGAKRAQEAASMQENECRGVGVLRSSSVGSSTRVGGYGLMGRARSSDPPLPLAAKPGTCLKIMVSSVRIWVPPLYKVLETVGEYRTPGLASSTLCLLCGEGRRPRGGDAGSHCRTEERSSHGRRCHVAGRSL